MVISDNKDKEASESPKEQELFKATESEYGVKYKEHLLEQYKLYVEMADRVSARRSTANAFFLTANTLLLSGSGILSHICSGSVISDPLAPAMALIGGILLCFAWKSIVKSYKQLNDGKFKIIHAIEKKLPIGLYEAEWKVLGEGKDTKKYAPLTRLESLIPNIFIILYILLLFVLTGFTIYSWLIEPIKMPS